MPYLFDTIWIHYLKQPGSPIYAKLALLQPADFEIQHLVEIAIEQPAVPAYRKRTAAHQAADGRWIEGVDERLHVSLKLIRSAARAATPQPCSLSANRGTLRWGARTTNC